MTGNRYDVLESRGICCLDGLHVCRQRQQLGHGDLLLNRCGWSISRDHAGDCSRVNEKLRDVARLTVRACGQHTIGQSKSTNTVWID
jgi:hypothetical protein